jgi:hypothetical protein
MATTKYRVDIEYINDSVEVVHGVMEYKSNGDVLYMAGTDFEIFLPLTSNVKMITITEEET